MNSLSSVLTYTDMDLAAILGKERTGARHQSSLGKQVVYFFIVLGIQIGWVVKRWRWSFLIWITCTLNPHQADYRLPCLHGKEWRTGEHVSCWWKQQTAHHSPRRHHPRHQLGNLHHLLDNQCSLLQSKKNQPFLAISLIFNFCLDSPKQSRSVHDKKQTPATCFWKHLFCVW